MDQLPDPNQPLTVSILRAALENLEAAGYGDTPVGRYVDGGPNLIIQMHNIIADTSRTAQHCAPALGFCSVWDVTRQGDAITNFVIL